MPVVNARGESTAVPGRPRWSTFPALALLVLLSCWGPTVDAAYDPMVEAVQEALTERGFEPGKIDGAMGSRTRSALREFQRSVGLPSTGEIDAATIAALGLGPPDSDEKPSAATSPPTPAARSDTAPEAAPSGTEPPHDAPRTEPARTESSQDAPRARPARTEPPQDASRTEPTRTEPSQGASRTEPTRTEPSQGAPRAEPARIEPPRPAPAPKPVLRFSTLGWHPPQTGAEALERFIAIGAPRDFKRGAGSLFVPKADLVFVLLAGERVPGLDCDPGAGRLTIEFVFGPDGPIIFTPAAGAELCRMGIGIALEIGRTLEMRPVDWGGVRYPQGKVRVTGKGLQYVD